MIIGLTMPTGTGLPDFDEPRLAEAVERLPPDCLDTLPIGIIRLDAGVPVVFSNKAGQCMPDTAPTAPGRPFLVGIAPWADQGGLGERIERALAAGRLDIEFDHVSEGREMELRVQSALGGGCWIFLRREG